MSTLRLATALTFACLLVAMALEIHNAAPQFWTRVFAYLLGAI